MSRIGIDVILVRLRTKIALSKLDVCSVAGNWLRKADPNHAALVCRLHGDRTDMFTLEPTDFCLGNWFIYSGVILRLRFDGSVQTARLRPTTRQDGSVHVGVWELCTDAPRPTDEPKP